MSDREPVTGISDAVRFFWQKRRQQSDRQGGGIDLDRGARTAVTGGKQMDGFVRLVHQRLVESRVPEASISFDRKIELPGWFRAEKKWDLVIVHNKELVAAVEFKSHIGPSFSNNFNNRTEEALGSATDIWAAYREGAFKPSARPFLGYLMLLEDCERSRSPIKVTEPHFPVFPEFKAASYAKRYEILLEKLLRERLYDGACFLLSSNKADDSGDYTEPNPELTFSKFITGLITHAAARCTSDA